MSTARLFLGKRLLAQSEGGFADPLPLVLFAAPHQLGADALLRTDRDAACQRLAALGADATAVETLRLALFELAPAPLARELAWAALPATDLLALETRRTARGFEHHFPRLDLAALTTRLGLASDRDSLSRHRQALALLAWAAHLAADTAPQELRYELADVLPTGADPAEYIASLAEARPTDGELSGALQALAAALPEVAVEEQEGSLRPQHLRALPANEAAQRLETALARQPELGPDDPLFVAALEAACAVRDAGQPSQAMQLLRPLVWRAPLALSATLATFDAMSASAPTELDTLLLSALMARGGSWRTHAVALGAALIDAGQLRRGLAVMRAASDIDYEPDPDEALQALVAELRRQLTQRYGLTVEGVGALEEARFLLDAQRHRGGDDHQGLARLLFDAVVGSLYEPVIADEAEREAFFELRIAPGLSYLEHDPLPGGGRVRLPDTRRSDESGPGLVAAVLFLLGLGALIALIGYLLLSHAA